MQGKYHVAQHATKGGNCRGTVLEGLHKKSSNPPPSSGHSQEYSHLPKQKFIKFPTESTDMLYHFTLLNKGNKQNHLLNLLFARQMDCLKTGNIDYRLPFNKAHGAFLSTPISSFWVNQNSIYIYIYSFPSKLVWFVFL